MTNKELYVEWEYFDVTVPKYQIDLYKDCLANFQWNFIEDTHNLSNSKQELEVAQNDQKLVTLKFKRDRKQDNKLQLNQLQQKCLEALKEVRSLEGKKSARKMGPLLGFGILGAFFTVFSIVKFTMDQAILGGAFLIIGLLGWALAYYFNLKEQKETNLYTPMIEEQFNTIYSTYKKIEELI